MIPTSYFVGVKVRSEVLVGLFVTLQKVLGDKCSCLEFQNILSVHATLFYLPALISPENLEKVKELIHLTNLHKISAKVEKYSFFGGLESPRLYYLLPDNILELGELNHTFMKEFPEYMDIPDNQYSPYIPHITLFKIVDMIGFLEKREELEAILSEEIVKIKSENLFETVNLFKVNSEFRPEVQISVL